MEEWAYIGSAEIFRFRQMLGRNLGFGCGSKVDEPKFRFISVSVEFRFRSITILYLLPDPRVSRIIWMALLHMVHKASFLIIQPNDNKACYSQIFVFRLLLVDICHFHPLSLSLSLLSLFQISGKYLIYIYFVLNENVILKQLVFFFSQNLENVFLLTKENRLLLILRLKRNLWFSLCRT